MSPFKLITLIVSLFYTSLGFAYQPFTDNDNYFLGHLKKNKYELDTSANAIVLYETGSYKMGRRGDGQLVFNITTRRIVKILSSAGIKQADISIPYYSSKNTESYPVKIVAKTYNLDNGQLKVTELDKKLITTEVANNYYKLLKFSLPAVIEGTIIDYSYEIEQEATLAFVEWRFQDDIPVMYSEVSATYENEFQVAAVTKSSSSFVLHDNKDVGLSDSEMPLAYRTSPVNYSNKTMMRWVRRNLPAIVDEPFNYNIDNYVDQLSIYIVSSPYDGQLKIGSWDGVNELMESSFKSYTNYIGSKTVLDNLLTEIFTNAKCTDGLDSAMKIYQFVRDNFNVSSKYSMDVSSKKLKTLIEKRSGTTAEINLLLYKLLLEAGYKSNIVIAATREAQKLLPQCPVLDNLNYMVCRTEINGRVFFLDGTEKCNPFGVLSQSCYNGFAWAIDHKGFGVNIAPDSLRERSSVVITTEQDNADDYRINITQIFGNVSGPGYRKSWIADTAEVQEYLHSVVKSLLLDAKLVDYNIANLHTVDEPLKISFRIKMTWPKDDKLFFATSFFNSFSSNPFKASIRYTPVEMPYTIDYNYMMILKFPASHTVTDVPGSVICKLDEKNSYRYVAEYNVSTNTLSVNTRLNMNSTFFDVINYKAVQTFFDKVIEQQQKRVLITKKPE